MANDPDKVVVKLLASLPGRPAGEVCGFSREYAEKLQRAGLAQIIRKVPKKRGRKKKAGYVKELGKKHKAQREKRLKEMDPTWKKQAEARNRTAVLDELSEPQE